MFKVTKNESSNKTIRMPDDLIKKLEDLANENDISFNKIVVQCCKYAIENLSSEIDKKKH